MTRVVGTADADGVETHVMSDDDLREQTAASLRRLRWSFSCTTATPARWYVVFESPEYSGYEPYAYKGPSAAHAAEAYRRLHRDDPTNRGAGDLAVAELADLEWFGDIPSTWPEEARAAMRRVDEQT